MNDDYSNLLEQLAGARVDFVIVGGFAGVVYGAPLLTQTIEICCDFSPAYLPYKKPYPICILFIG